MLTGLSTMLPLLGSDTVPRSETSEESLVFAVTSVAKRASPAFPLLYLLHKDNGSCTVDESIVQAFEICS